MTLTAYRSIFRIRDFRLFWLGFTASVLGDALTRVAFTWFVYELTHSAEALGILMLCYTGPIIVGGLVAGWLLDRFNRRNVMIADNLIRGGTVLLIPLLYAFGQLQLWHIYVVAVVYGLFMMIGLAGSPSIVPDLVSRSQLETANALETLSYTLGGVVGPAIAGVLISGVGAPNVVILDGISYFIFALFLWRIPAARLTTALHTETKQYSIGHAVQLLLRNPVLLSTTLMFLTFNVGGGGLLSVWLPILSDRVLNGGAELYGLLLSALSVGEVLSAALAGSLSLPFALGTRICFAQILAGLSLCLILFVPNAAAAIVALALFGVFSAPLTIWAQTLRMQVIPEHMRGRTFALLRMLMQSGNPVGGALGGWLLPLLGIPAVMGLSSLLVGLPGVLGYGVKALRNAGNEGRQEQPALHTG